MNASPNAPRYGRDMPERPEPRISRFRKAGYPVVQIRCEYATTDDLLALADLAAGREEAGITRSTWSSSLPRQPLDEARGGRN